MRKLYNIINVLTFLLIVYYSTSGGESTPQLKHGVIVMSCISLLCSAYMTYFEYTDTSEEQQYAQVNSIKTTYKHKLKEMNEKENYMKNIQDENKQLVNDLTYTKKIVNQLADVIEENDDIQPEPQEHRDEMDSIPSIDYHVQNNNSQQLANNSTDSGPPLAMNTHDTGPIDLDKSLKEYDSLLPKQDEPDQPDWLKPIKTNPNKQSNDDMYDY